MYHIIGINIGRHIQYSWPLINTVFALSFDITKKVKKKIVFVKYANIAMITIKMKTYLDSNAQKRLFAMLM